MPQIITRVVVLHETLAFPEGPPPDAAGTATAAAFQDLARACFGAPDSRPSFDALYVRIKQLLLEQKRAEDLIAKECPEMFLCPISMDIMTDPVIMCDGFSYDRQCIEHWLAASNLSPMTGLPLTRDTLIPNVALRQAIEAFV